MRFASGSSVNPEAWPMPMGMVEVGAWRALWMGQAFVDTTYQSGSRGGRSFFLPNSFMLAALRPLAGGGFMVRAMTSLEPATVPNRRYPLLFQTGETAFGEPIVDGQHPHDFFMELGVHYARQVSDAVLLHGSYAFVGDPALGPTAFPHRASAMELPQATLGHHWQDSTHIASQVVTAGVALGKLRWEASAFHGGEPDEDRWDLDVGGIDSYATRVSFAPGREWVGQASVGRLAKPEAFHEDDVVRATASIQHSRAFGDGRAWSSTLLWARNYKTVERRATRAVLAETVLPLAASVYLTGRVEWSERDELFSAEDVHFEHHEDVFDVWAFTAGLTRDVHLVPGLATGLGGNFTFHAIPEALEPVYGRRPYGLNVFLRVRIVGDRAHGRTP